MVAPWWELFVQLADYGWLRSIAERYGQQVRLEDRLMDLTVSIDERLILYVEQKEKSTSAEKLLERMQYYGQIGFDMDDPDRGNDPLRKAKYIVRKKARPLYFGISAIGYRQLFKVEYLNGNRFRLVEDDRGFSAPLAEHSNPQAKSSMTWSAVDPLASEIERLCPEIWISVGAGKTAYNFYIPGKDGDAIIIGVYESGEVWTDVSGLGQELAASFASELEKSGIFLDNQKQWGFWKSGVANFNLSEADPVAIASAVRSVLLDPSWREFTLDLVRRR